MIRRHQAIGSSQATLEAKERSSASLHLNLLDLASGPVADVLKVLAWCFMNGIEEGFNGRVSRDFFSAIELIPSTQAVADAEESEGAQAPNPTRSGNTLSFGAFAWLKRFHGVFRGVSSTVSVSPVDDRKINLSLETARGRLNGTRSRIEALEALSEARTVFLVVELAPGVSFNRANTNSSYTLVSVARKVASDDRQDARQVSVLIVKPQMPVGGSVFVRFYETSTRHRDAFIVQIALNFVPHHSEMAAASLGSTNAVIRRTTSSRVGVEAGRESQGKKGAR